MHPEYEKISQYVVPASNRKLTVLLILLSTLVTLLTIWFLPILDHLFTASAVSRKLKPVELTAYRPEPPKLFQEQPVRKTSHDPAKFTEALPKRQKTIFNPRVILSRHVDAMALDLAISTDLNFSVLAHEPSFSGLGLGGLVFSLNQVDERPIALSKLQPNYPFRARRRGIEGEVLLSFVITEKGDVQQIKVLNSKPKGTFDEQAKQAVRVWKFKPAKKDGHAVSVIRKQLIKFGLK